MDVKRCLTILVVLSVLYAAAIILLPGPSIVTFGGPAEAHTMQLFGAALLASAATQTALTNTPSRLANRYP
jgi:hypothetical protein